MAILPRPGMGERRRRVRGRLRSRGPVLQPPRRALAAGALGAVRRRPGDDRAGAALADRAPGADLDAELPPAPERDDRRLGPAAPDPRAADADGAGRRP